MSDVHDQAKRPPAELDDKPPLLGSWRNIYLVVLGVLVAVVTIFAVLTEVYA